MSGRNIKLLTFEEIKSAAEKFSLVDEKLNHLKNDDFGKLFLIKHASRVSALRNVCKEIANGNITNIDEVKDYNTNLSGDIINRIPFYAKMLELLSEKLDKENELKKVDVTNELQEFRTTAKELVKHTKNVKFRDGVNWWKFGVIAAALIWGIWECKCNTNAAEDNNSIGVTSTKEKESKKDTTLNHSGLSILDILKYKDEGRSICYQVEKDIQKTFQKLKEELQRKKLIGVNLDKVKQDLFTQLEKMKNLGCTESPLDPFTLGNSFYHLFLLNDALGRNLECESILKEYKNKEFPKSDGTIELMSDLFNYRTNGLTPNIDSNILILNKLISHSKYVGFNLFRNISTPKSNLSDFEKQLQKLETTKRDKIEQELKKSRTERRKKIVIQVYDHLDTKKYKPQGIDKKLKEKGYPLAKLLGTLGENEGDGDFQKPFAYYTPEFEKENKDLLDELKKISGKYQMWGKSYVRSDESKVKKVIEIFSGDNPPDILFIF